MIQRLVVSNFKSYKGRTEIDFGDSAFSAIIGPNGVGKSNLMDAISFGFGSSLVDLRTRTFSDLIWRDPENSTSAGSGFVEIHFDDCVLRRDLGSSATHFIDGEQVELQEYTDKLESLGISKHNNSLVFQGSIERMASLSAHQLGALFEEISGSDQYRNEYNAHAQELEAKKQAASNVGRAKAKQLALVKRLTASSETARERGRLETRIKKLGGRELALRAAYLDTKVSETERDIKRLKREKKLAKTSASSSSSEAAAIKKQLVQTIRDIQQREDAVQAAQNSAKRATAGLLSAQTLLEDAVQRLDDLEPQVSTTNKELSLFNEDTKSLENKLKTTERGFQRLLDEIPIYEGDQELYGECNQRFKLETALDQAEIERIRRQIATLESDLHVLAGQQEQLEARALQINHQHRVAELKTRESEAKIERCDERIENLQEQSSAAVAELHALKSTISDQESSLRQHAKKLSEMQSDKRKADKRNSLLERVQKLKRRFPGVSGVLYTLIQPKEDRFAAAVDLTLGGNFNAVVVDSVSTARQCIEFCQSNNLGIMTFLPLDGLTSRPIESRLRSIDGARLAVDAVTYEREFAAAIAYVCSDTLLCDTIDVAYSLRSQNYRVKLVTVDGTVLHSNNIVTAGGQLENRFDKSRAATLRAQVVDLMETLKVNKLNETSLSQQVYSLEERLKELKSRRDILSEQAQAESHTLEAFDHDVEACRRQRQDLDGREHEIRESLEECETEMRTIKRGFASLKKRVFQPFTATTDVDIDTYQDALEKRQKLTLDLENQRLRLKSELEYAQAKQHGCQSRLDTLQEKVEALQTTKATAGPKIEECRSILANSKQSTMSLQDEISNFEARVEALNTQLVEIQGQELDSGDKTDELQQQIDELDAARTKSQEQRELIEDCDEELAAELVESLESTAAIQAELDKVQADVRAAAADRENLLVGHESEDLDEAEESLSQLVEELNEAQQAVNRIERSLSKVRTKRTKELLKVLEPVQDAVKVIYKELTTTNIDPLGGTAALRPINEAEPFLEGIKFSAMPPRKPFTDISSLSGGEKTIAALALIFALNTFRSSPIYVLDEVDAALDYANVHLVAKYIAKCATEGSQFVVISLKLWFFEHASSLLGVYRKKDVPGSKLISYALSAEST